MKSRLCTISRVLLDIAHALLSHYIPRPRMVMIVPQLISLVLNTLEGHVEAAIKDGDVDAEIVVEIP